MKVYREATILICSSPEELVDVLRLVKGRLAGVDNAGPEGNDMVVEVLVHPQQELPPGWSWGSHWSREGAEGYYAIDDESGRAVPVRLVPDLAFLADPDELAEELEAALRAGAPGGKT